jgi:hypothetical protein
LGGSRIEEKKDDEAAFRTALLICGLNGRKCCGWYTMIEEWSIKLRTSSNLLIDAAICFIHESLQIEQRYDKSAANDIKQTQLSKYRACVIGALFASVSFLDAAINELFLDAVDCLPMKYRKDAQFKNNKRKKFADKLVISSNQVSSFRNNTLSPAVVKDMAQLWLRQQQYASWVKQNPSFKTYLSNKKRGNNVSFWLPVWDKYQLALFLNKKTSTSKRNPKRKNVQTVIDVRNELIHFKPSVSQGSSQSPRLEPIGRDLKSIKRRVDALIASEKNRPYNAHEHEEDILTSGFPYDFLSARFARLALQSVLQFDEHFCKKMGLESARTRFSLEQQIATIRNP